VAEDCRYLLGGIESIGLGITITRSFWFPTLTCVSRTLSFEFHVLFKISNFFSGKNN
jgi:hypothetical protein